MAYISAVVSDDIGEYIDFIAKNFGGNRSKAIGIILSAVFSTEEGKQLTVNIEGENMKISDLIEKGRQEVQFDDLRKYSDRPLHKNFVRNMTNLPYLLKHATLDFIMSVISFIKANGEHPFVGTAQNISIYGNGKHLLYVNINRLTDKILISKFMQCNRKDNQPEKPYVWNEICYALDEHCNYFNGTAKECYEKGVNMPVDTIALTEQELNILNQYFKERCRL